MNSEIIKTLAANAIGKWARECHGNCVLSIDDGRVIASEPTDNDRIHNRSLIITRFAQNAGLTNAAWRIVGTELLNLYNKEKACQKNGGKLK